MLSRAGEWTVSDALARRVGASTTLTKQLSEADVALFALVVGEAPTASEEPAASARPTRQIAPNALLAAILGTVAARLAVHPGGARVLTEQIHYHEAAFTDDTLTTTASVIGVDAPSESLRISAQCLNQDGRRVADGEFLLRDV